jgi:hypothetical protein
MALPKRKRRLMGYRQILTDATVKLHMHAGMLLMREASAKFTNLYAFTTAQAGRTTERRFCTHNSDKPIATCSTAELPHNIISAPLTAQCNSVKHFGKSERENQCGNENQLHQDISRASMPIMHSIITLYCIQYNLHCYTYNDCYDYTRW